MKNIKTLLSIIALSALTFGSITKLSGVPGPRYWKCYKHHSEVPKGYCVPRDGGGNHCVIATDNGELEKSCTGTLSSLIPE